MKKGILIAAVVLLVAVGAAMISRSFSQQAASAGFEPSKASAESLRNKIDAVQRASADAGERRREQVEVSEAELESYVLVFLRKEMPVQLDSMDVQLTTGAVAGDAQITFNSSPTGNPMIDALAGGTHNVFVKGKLAGANSEGRFELEEVRVDGIPVPKVLIETLFEKYVKPRYPEADMKAPFELPWGIQELTIEPGKARIVY